MHILKCFIKPAGQKNHVIKYMFVNKVFYNIFLFSNTRSWTRNDVVFSLHDLWIKVRVALTTAAGCE